MKVRFPKDGLSSFPQFQNWMTEHIGQENIDWTVRDIISYNTDNWEGHSICLEINDTAKVILYILKWG